MSSHLRNVMFRLLNGLTILERLREILKQGTTQLSHDDRSNIQELISFLDQVKQDTHRYVTEEKIEDSEMGSVFNNFLAALSLTQDPRLTRGPAYAVANVALDNVAWPRVIRDFSSEEERKVTQDLSSWTSSLNDVLDTNCVMQSQSDLLDKMIFRFNKTTGMLEQALREWA